MREDVQSSITQGGGTRLADLRKVNNVFLGGENDGEHLLKKRRRRPTRPVTAPCGQPAPRPYNRAGEAGSVPAAP